MPVRETLQQQTRSADQTTRSTTERPEKLERPERRERPERAERPESPDVAPRVNQVIVRNGVPVIPAIPAVPAIPSIEVHTGGPSNVIPPQVVDLAFGAFVMLAVVVIGWPLSRAFGRRLERSGQSAAISPALTDQLRRIEQAVDAMSIEVERISESQRYLTKIQTAQLGDPATLPASERR